jgi:hypothetical protein
MQQVTKGRVGEFSLRRQISITKATAAPTPIATKFGISVLLDESMKAEGQSSSSQQHSSLSAIPKGEPNTWPSSHTHTYTHTHSNAQPNSTQMQPVEVRNPPRGHWHVADCIAIPAGRVINYWMLRFVVACVACETVCAAVCASAVLCSVCCVCVSAKEIHSTHKSSETNQRLQDGVPKTSRRLVPGRHGC